MEVSPLKKGVNGLMDYWKLCPTMDIGILLRVCAMWVVDAAVGALVQGNVRVAAVF